MTTRITPSTGPLDGGHSDIEAAERLVAFYERLSSVSLEDCDPDGVAQLIQAMREDRVADAIGLLDSIDVDARIGAVGADLDLDDDAPPPSAAQVCRFDWDAPAVRGRPYRLHVVDSDRASDLEPARTLEVRPGRRWQASFGDLGPFRRSRLSLGLKGELLLILFSGSLRIANADGDLLGEVAAEPDLYTATHFFFCRQMGNETPLDIQFVAGAEESVHGLWCLSSSWALDPERDQDRPHNQDLFMRRELLPFGREKAPDGAFCPGAVERSTENYPHRDVTKRAELQLSSLDPGQFSAHEGWALADASQVSRISGIQPGSVEDAVTAGARQPRRLAAHGPGVELLLALGGISWVAVSGKKEGNPEDERTYALTDDLVNPERLPAQLEALTTSGRSGRDGMLLNSSYYHTAWMQPGSSARLLHASFSDPRDIEVKKLGSRERETPPARHVASASRSGGSRAGRPW